MILTTQATQELQQIKKFDQKISTQIILDLAVGKVSGISLKGHNNDKKIRLYGLICTFRDNLVAKFRL